MNLPPPRRRLPLRMLAGVAAATFLAFSGTALAKESSGSSQGKTVASPTIAARPAPEPARKKPHAVASGKAWSNFKENYIGAMQLYSVQKEDTFVYIARDYNLGYVELRAANPTVDPWLPEPGKNIILPTMHLLPQTPRQGIVVNLPEMRLYSYDKPGQPPHTYSIGIGREGLNTPTGTTKVIKKVEGPTWRPTPRMRIEDPTLPEIVPPGPANPMGTHALYTTWSEYRIHGTDKPFGIGRRVSSGCMRLYPEGIIDLYARTPVGTSVTVVDQPVKAAWIGEEFFIEAHPSIEQADQMEEEGHISTYRLSEDDYSLILRIAGDRAEALDWDRIREAVRERRGYPVLVGRIGGLKGDETARLNAAQPKPAARSGNESREAAAH